jgi:hypothetical protein
MRSDPRRVGGDALLLCREMQRIPARQGFGHWRGATHLHLAPHVTYGNGELAREAAAGGATRSGREQQPNSIAFRGLHQ